LAVALLLAEGAVHLQQVEGPLKAVPTINTLFVLNVVGAAIVALVLAGSRERVAVLAALAGLSLTLTALVSLAIRESARCLPTRSRRYVPRSRSQRWSNSPRSSLWPASCSRGCAGTPSSAGPASTRPHHRGRPGEH
jgi:hypothetical protein